jgi:hypothetical protein
MVSLDISVILPLPAYLVRNPWGSDLYFLHFRFAKTQKDKRQTPFFPGFGGDEGVDHLVLL